MSEEKKEGSCCSSSKGCGCCKGVKIIVGLLVGALIFAAGMCVGKHHCCHKMGGDNFCPLSGSVGK